MKHNSTMTAHLVLIHELFQADAHKRLEKGLEKFGYRKITPQIEIFGKQRVIALTTDLDLPHLDFLYLPNHEDHIPDCTLNSVRVVLSGIHLPDDYCHTYRRSRITVNNSCHATFENDCNDLVLAADAPREISPAMRDHKMQTILNELHHAAKYFIHADELCRAASQYADVPEMFAAISKMLPPAHLPKPAAMFATA